MKKKFLTIGTALSVAVLSAFAIAMSVDGRWSGKTVMDGNDIPLTYTFKADGAKLTGTAESPYGTSTIDNGKIKGDSIYFSTNVSGMEIPQMGKVFADSVSLDISANGNILHAKLTRAK